MALMLMGEDKKELALHSAHVSYQHFRWQLLTRRFLLLWEPNQWHHTFLIQNAAAVAVQRRIRGILVRSTSNVDRAARKLQSTIRMVRIQRQYIQQKKATTIFQSAWRGVAERMGNVWKRRYDFCIRLLVSIQCANSYAWWTETSFFFLSHFFLEHAMQQPCVSRHCGVVTVVD